MTKDQRLLAYSGPLSAFGFVQWTATWGPVATCANMIWTVTPTMTSAITVTAAVLILNMIVLLMVCCAMSAALPDALRSGSNKYDLPTSGVIWASAAKQTISQHAIGESKGSCGQNVNFAIPLDIRCASRLSMAPAVTFACDLPSDSSSQVHHDIFAEATPMHR